MPAYTEHLPRCWGLLPKLPYLKSPWLSSVEIPRPRPVAKNGLCEWCTLHASSAQGVQIAEWSSIRAFLYGRHMRRAKTGVFAIRRGRVMKLYIVLLKHFRNVLTVVITRNG